MTTQPLKKLEIELDGEPSMHVFGWVVFLYGPPTKCYVAYTVIRRKIVFISAVLVMPFIQL